MNRLFRSIILTLTLLLIQSRAFSEEILLSQLSGARIDSNWFRYTNLRFGAAIDIPTQGYRYEIPVNGSGLTVTSTNGAVVITVYTHFVTNSFDGADNDVRKSISHLFDSAVIDTQQKQGTVTYSVKKDDFYVISGKFGDNTYYERMTISAHCPAIFNSFRIFYPSAMDRDLDALVTRMSNSLRATCQGEEGAAKFN